MPNPSKNKGTREIMLALPTPPKTKYNYINLGAGVQSSTMALMATHGEITPMPNGAIFADTQHESHQTYEWLDWLIDQLAFPVIQVTAGSLVERELHLRVSTKSGKTVRRTAIPAFTKKPDGSIGILGRKCTSDYKIVPIVKELRKLAKIKRGQKDTTVTQWFGISFDEITRMKAVREPWSQARWPLIERRMTRQDCKKWMQNHNYPEPPRSACIFCPFHSDVEWERIKKETPDEFDEVVEFEKKMQAASEKDEFLISTPYLHPSCQPIDQVDTRSSEEKSGQMSLDTVWNTIENECEGMCGV